MKQVRFRGLVNGKLIRGNWFCEIRPNKAQTVAERLLGYRINKFMFVVTDVKTKMVIEE